MSGEPSAEQLSIHAINLRNAGLRDAAETIARRAAAMDPDNPVVLANLGVVLLATNKATESRKITQQAMQLAPHLAGKLRHNLGLAYLNCGEPLEALKQLAQAEPTLDAQFDRAAITLLTGQWREGWRLMEIRRQRDKHPITYSMPEWDGSPVDGTLWVEAEQGFGDMINFARYLPWARSQCKRLVFSVNAGLMNLFYGYPGVDELRLQEENVPHPADALFHAPLQSLAMFHGTMPESVPADPGHFRARAESWPVITDLPAGTVLAAGLCWAGNPKHARDAERSIPFEMLLPLLTDPRVDFTSLQVGSRATDPERSGVGALVTDMHTQLTSWMRTAAAVKALDVVITVDTAVAHLAGALGVRTFLMLPKVPDWRWGVSSKETPWYPSMRIFRQQRHGDWAPVVDGIRSALQIETEKHQVAMQRAAA